MKVSTFFKFVFLMVVSGFFLFALIVLAQSGPPADANADLAGGFDKVLNKIHGAMIRVPINKQGDENTNMSELRVYTADDKISSPADLQTAWERSEIYDKVPQITSSDIDKDSSTFGWWRWQGYGWREPYWYGNYRPSFYWGGYSWNYGNPFWYNNWNWGYRYYYYPSYYYWR